MEQDYLSSLIGLNSFNIEDRIQFMFAQFRIEYFTDLYQYNIKQQRQCSLKEIIIKLSITNTNCNCVIEFYNQISITFIRS